MCTAAGALHGDGGTSLVVRLRAWLQWAAAARLNRGPARRGFRLRAGRLVRQPKSGPRPSRFVLRKVFQVLFQVLSADFLEWLDIFGPFDEESATSLQFGRAEASPLVHDPLPSQRYHICKSTSCRSFCHITTPPQPDSAQHALDSILCDRFSHVFRMGDETCTQNRA